MSTEYAPPKSEPVLGLSSFVGHCPGPCQYTVLLPTTSISGCFCCTSILCNFVSWCVVTPIFVDFHAVPRSPAATSPWDVPDLRSACRAWRCSREAFGTSSGSHCVSFHATSSRRCPGFCVSAQTLTAGRSGFVSYFIANRCARVCFIVDREACSITMLTPPDVLLNTSWPKPGKARFAFCRPDADLEHEITRDISSPSTPRSDGPEDQGSEESQKRWNQAEKLQEDIRKAGEAAPPKIRSKCYFKILVVRVISNVNTTYSRLSVSCYMAYSLHRINTHAGVVLQKLHVLGQGTLTALHLIRHCAERRLVRQQVARRPSSRTSP